VLPDVAVLVGPALLSFTPGFEARICCLLVVMVTTLVLLEPQVGRANLLYPFTFLYLFISNGLHRGSASTKLRVMSLISQGYTGVGLVPEQLSVTHKVD
jgi:hypothetical protein